MLSATRALRNSLQWQFGSLASCQSLQVWWQLVSKTASLHSAWQQVRVCTFCDQKAKVFSAADPDFSLSIRMIQSTSSNAHKISQVHGNKRPLKTCTVWKWPKCLGFLTPAALILILSHFVSLHSIRILESQTLHVCNESYTLHLQGLLLQARE